MDGNDLLERNRRFVIGHFDDFVNKKDLDAIDRNMAADFVDHDGPGGRPTDRAGDPFTSKYASHSPKAIR